MKEIKKIACLAALSALCTISWPSLASEGSVQLSQEENEKSVGVMNLEDDTIACFDESDYAYLVQNPIFEGYGEKEYERLGIPYPLENAYSDLLEGKYEQVRNAATTVLYLAPNDYWALENRAYANANLGDFEAAIKDLHKILELTEYTFYDQMGNSLRLLKYISDSHPFIFEAEFLPTLKKIRKINKNTLSDRDAECIYYLCNLLSIGFMNHGYNNKALEYAQIALDNIDTYHVKHFDNNTDAIVGCSTILMHMMRPEDAKKLIEKYFDVEKDEYLPSGVINNYYMALEDAGKVKESEKFLNRQIERYLPELQSKLMKADLCATHGRYKEAIALYNELWESSTGDMIEDDRHYALRYARFLELDGQKEKSREILNEIIADNDADSYATFAFAMLGNEERARALSADWTSEDVFPSLASLEYLLGNEDKALDLLEESYKKALWYPAATARDIFSQQLMKNPRYSEIAKLAIPSR